MKGGGKGQDGDGDYLSEEEMKRRAKMRNRKRHRRRVQSCRLRHVTSCEALKKPGTMSSLFKIPKLEDVPKMEKGAFFRIGGCQCQGRRPAQEDSYTIKVSEDFTCIGLFDGHNGGDASNACSEAVSSLVGSTLKSKKLALVEKYAGNAPDKGMLSSMKVGDVFKWTLREVFFQLNENLVAKNIAQGTCGSVICIVGQTLVTANLGDSKIVLFSRDGKKSKALTYDHTPTNPNEVKRIGSLGGQVVNGRINGLLNISGCLGDNFSKLIQRDPYVTATKLDLGTYSCVLVASDGVWNFVSMEKIRGLVHQIDDPRELSHKLMTTAFENGSTDNISVCTVRLDSK